MPRVSVVIPAYNAEATIGKCLASLSAQTFRDFEAIVADDGSTDQTAEIAARFATVVRAERNLGAGAARNLGASRAVGNILAFTDSDVVLPSDWLARIVKLFDERGARCVGGPYRGSVGNTFLERFAHLELVHRRRHFPESVRTLVANNFACDRQLFLECGGFPKQPPCEDLLLSFEIGKRVQILWDRENGVWHHFRTSLRGYLKQQFHFAKDTVWSYYQYPEMLRVQTHQGRGLYLEVAWTALTVPFFPLWIAGTAMLNLDLLRFLRREGLPVLRALGVILARDLVCVGGILGGILLCLRDALRRAAGRPPIAER